MTIPPTPPLTTPAPPQLAGATGVRLVPLDCPGCGSALAAEAQDVVYYCTGCRNGYRLVSGGDGGGRDPGRREAGLEPRLEPIEVRFVATPAVAPATHLPFWLLPARVVIHQREASGAMVAGLLKAFLGADPGGVTSGDAAYFVIPAFPVPLATTVELTRRYSAALPTLGERQGERLLGGSLSAADAEKLAHYALIATEMGRPDLLRSLRYEIHFGAPCLLGVPFVRRDGGLVDALFGIGVPS